MLSLALSAADLCYPTSISEIISSIDGSRLWTDCLGRRCPTPSVLESNPTIKPRKSGNSRWNTRRGPDHPPLLADLDPELHRLPLGIPAGGLGERRLGNVAPGVILLGGCGRK